MRYVLTLLVMPALTVLGLLWGQDGVGQEPADEPVVEAPPSLAEHPDRGADFHRHPHHFHRRRWSYSPYWHPPYYYESYYVLPPVWLPSEYLYGPLAMQRFMGVGPIAPGAGAGPNGSIIVPGAGRIGQAHPPQAHPPQPNPGQGNPGQGAAPAQPAAAAQNPAMVGGAAHDLARRFIGFGDAYFQKQKYVDANQRYRRATEIAPQLDEAHFRYGFSLLAMARYDLAAKAFKRGLALDPDWPKSGFRLRDLYGQNHLARKSHLDAVADASNKSPADADLLFLVGLLLHVDGQQARARPILQRAIQLAGGDDAHLRAFR